MSMYGRLFVRRFRLPKTSGHPGALLSLRIVVEVRRVVPIGHWFVNAHALDPILTAWQKAWSRFMMYSQRRVFGFCLMEFHTKRDAIGFAEERLVRFRWKPYEPGLADSGWKLHRIT